MHFVEIRTDVSIYTVMKLLSVRVSECPGCQQCSSEASLSFRSDSAQRISVGLIPPMKLKSSRSPHKYKVQWLDAILDFFHFSTNPPQCRLDYDFLSNPWNIQPQSSPSTQLMVADCKGKSTKKTSVCFCCKKTESHRIPNKISLLLHIESG